MRSSRYTGRHGPTAALTRPPGERLPTRDEAISAAARCFAKGLRIRDSLPVAEAARRAHRAGGPSIHELERRIRARRHGLGVPE